MDLMDQMLARDPQEIMEGAYAYVSASLEREGITVPAIVALRMLDEIIVVLGFERGRASPVV